MAVGPLTSVEIDAAKQRWRVSALDVNSLAEALSGLTFHDIRRLKRYPDLWSEIQRLAREHGLIRTLRKPRSGGKEVG